MFHRCFHVGHRRYINIVQRRISVIFNLASTLFHYVGWVGLTQFLPRNARASSLFETTKIIKLQSEFELDIWFFLSVNLKTIFFQILPLIGFGSSLNVILIIQGGLNMAGIEYSSTVHSYITAQKMKFSFKHFSSKCDEIRSFVRIWSYLLEKSFMENFIFCSVLNLIYARNHLQYQLKSIFSI